MTGLDIIVGMGGLALSTIAMFGGLLLRLRTLEVRQARFAEKFTALEAVPVEIRQLREDFSVTVARTLGEVQLQQARIEEVVKALPTHESLEKLHGRISKNGEITQGVAVKVATMEAGVDGIRDAVNRLHSLELAREQKG